MRPNDRRMVYEALKQAGFGTGDIRAMLVDESSLRDVFANSALKGMLSSNVEMGPHVLDEMVIARLAYRFADAMLEARKEDAT